MNRTPIIIITIITILSFFIPNQDNSYSFKDSKEGIIFLFAINNLNDWNGIEDSGLKTIEAINSITPLMSNEFKKNDKGMKNLNKFFDISYNPEKTKFINIITSNPKKIKKGKEYDVKLEIYKNFYDEKNNPIQSQKAIILISFDEIGYMKDFNIIEDFKNRQ